MTVAYLGCRKVKYLDLSYEKTIQLRANLIVSTVLDTRHWAT